MNNKIKFAIAGALGLVAGGAYNSIADVLVTAGAGTTVFDFVCFATKHCPTAVLTNSAGTEIATAGAPVRIDPTGTTPQPVTMTSTTITGTVAATQSGTWTVQPGNTANTTPWLFNESQINGVTPLMGNGITGTGSQRVTIASDNTAFSVNAAATLNAETTKVIGTVRNLGNAGQVVDFAGQNASSPSNSWLVGAQFNTTPTTVGNGNVSPLQMDSAGNLLVNIKAGAGSGGTALQDAAPYTLGTTNMTPVGCTFNSGSLTLTSGTAGALSCTTGRSLHTTVDTVTNWAGGALGAMANYGTSPGAVLVPGVNAFVTNATPLGQAAMAASSPVVIASNQSSIPVASTPVSQYPATAVPYTASATGTTAATTATLAGASSVTTYICGFSIRANATAAVTGNATVTGTITGTLNYTQWTAPLASGLGVTEQIFTPCVPASAANTSIAVVSAAPGTGGVVSVTSWGYKL